jgi:hypothetical protein
VANDNEKTVEFLARQICHAADGGKSCGCATPGACWNWELCTDLAVRALVENLKLPQQTKAKRQNATPDIPQP